MSMIERVARAIYDKPTKFDGDQIGVHLSQSMMIEGSATNVEELRAFVMGVCLDAARAAMEEMMTPTERMISSAGGTDIRDAKRSIYTSMIQAALEEK